MSSLFLLLVVIVGLAVIIACSFWVMSATALEGSFRIKTQALKTCPKCGATLDNSLDCCPKCSLRVSV